MLLVEDNYYHVYSRSIAKYVVFNNADEYMRFIDIVSLCRHENFHYKYSKFLELNLSTQKAIIQKLKDENSVLIKIVAYCVMPTHIHFLLKQSKSNGISKFMLRVMSSYSRYFNQKHHRNGPLWGSRFKNVLVSTDEQLIHLTRYIHLNPVSAGLINNPEDWTFSSLGEYTDDSISVGICDFREVVNMSPQKYQKFVHDQKSYQRKISLIKNILIDDYFG